MTEAEVKQAVFGVLGKIAPEADLAKLRPDENLREALDIDSFDFLQFVIGLHENLQVEIPEAEYPQLTTLSGILRYVGTNRAR